MSKRVRQVLAFDDEGNLAIVAQNDIGCHNAVLFENRHGSNDDFLESVPFLVVALPDEEKARFLLLDVEGLLDCLARESDNVQIVFRLGR